MTPPNVILGLAIQEFGAKLAYVHARRARIASALESLQKIADASEMATEQVGGTPGYAPGKRPPAPQLGKPIPMPPPAYTTKNADTLDKTAPKRGVEPALTEKLRQGLEAQTLPTAGDNAMKMAAWVSKKWIEDRHR